MFQIRSDSKQKWKHMKAKLEKELKNNNFSQIQYNNIILKDKKRC